MFAGLGAARIRKLFAEARKNAPAIVFIDELDAVGAQRTGHGFNREQDQTLNQLLVELDGFEGARAGRRHGRVQPHPGSRPRRCCAPAASTGRCSSRRPISRAATRSSRVHTRGKPLAPGVELTQVAQQTSGLTGAELANICNEAAIFAGRRDDAYVTQNDFDDALERVVAGLQQKKVLTEKERRILAYHEGGHALMSHLMGARDGAAEGDDRLARRRARLRVPSARRGSLPAHEGGAHRPDDRRARRPRSRGGRVRSRHERRRERSREGHRRSRARWSSSGAWRTACRRARCAPTTTRCRRRRSGSATPSRPASRTRAYEEALRLLQKHRAPLDRLAAALLEQGDARSGRGARAAGGRRAGVARVREPSACRRSSRRSYLPSDDRSTAPFGASIVSLPFQSVNVIVALLLAAGDRDGVRRARRGDEERAALRRVADLDRLLPVVVGLALVLDLSVLAERRR